MEWNPPIAPWGKYIYFCVGDTVAFKVDEHSNMTLSNGKTSCPNDAKRAALVSTDYPLVFKFALVFLGLSSTVQVFLVRGTD